MSPFVRNALAPYATDLFKSTVLGIPVIYLKMFRRPLKWNVSKFYQSTRSTYNTTKRVLRRLTPSICTIVTRRGECLVRVMASKRSSTVTKTRRVKRRGYPFVLKNTFLTICGNDKTNRRKVWEFEQALLG